MSNLLANIPITEGNILRCRKGPIVRSKGQEPYESEVLLVYSNYTKEPKDSLLDLKPLPEGKYYLVTLPIKVPARETGATAIHKHWLDTAKVYSVLDDAIEAYDHVR